MFPFAAVAFVLFKIAQEDQTDRAAARAIS